jgi:hypothetical protein
MQAPKVQEAPLKRDQPAEQEKVACVGRVSDKKGNGIVDVTVMAIAPGGEVSKGVTDSLGNYRIGAIGSGPFILMFRAPKTQLTVLEVRQLTAAQEQKVSVTIDLSEPNFESAYSVLQSLESLLVLGLTMNKSESPILKEYGSSAVGELARTYIMSNSELLTQTLSVAQHRFISLKSELIRQAAEKKSSQ